MWDYLLTSLQELRAREAPCNPKLLKPPRREAPCVPRPSPSRSWALAVTRPS